MTRSLLLLLTALSACATPEQGEEPPTPAMIGDRDLPPLPDGAFRISTPVLEVAPGQETFWCYYGTYDGPDAGVYKMIIHDDPIYSHHSLLKAPLPEEDADKSDGTLIDCSGLAEQFPPRPTLLESVNLNPDPRESEPHEDGDTKGGDYDPWLDGQRWVDLPPELAFRFDSGQRWLVDAHFINTTDQPIRTRVFFDLFTEPQEDVGDFVNTWNHDAGGFALPPGQETTLRFSCPWERDVTILAIGGHMHGWGDRYNVDLVDPQGTLRPAIYAVDRWTDEMRFNPPTDVYQPGEFQVKAGDSFLTACTWNNTTERSLSFPDEMCTTFGVGYPIDDAIYCIGHGQPDGPPPN